MKQRPASFIGARRIALLGVVCALGLSSCKKENAPNWWKNLWGSDKETEVAPPAPVAVNHEQAEMLDYMIYSVGALVSQQASNPLWREEVRDMRNRLENYYNGMEARGASLAERVKLGLFLANATRDLTAYDQALEIYNTTLANWEALPEEVRNSVEGRRSRSAIANGMGSCYLARRKTADAMPFYEKALEIDMALFNELAPANDAPLPSGDALPADLARSAEDVLSSIRCLGECQFLAEDPEEARDTYKRGQELAMRMKNLSPAISIQYIRLLSAMGNLESRCGQPRQAYAAWTTAAGIAQRLRQVVSSPSLQAQIVRYMRELEPSIKSVAKQLEETQRAEAEQEAAAGQQ